ncbi:protein SUPPRESSOR OF K(+) TRANSPORT GROWTH DEFECT 1-like [Quercus lobata]|uniref:protein SUPPRESSOR OF K(+) TRANSPORT GROWTH DEFECT 1-like n=1 Tax=Quercus lobata TaxID=97700 RepID=UPI001244A7A0|nr:protein SUPPRESSOR OF K(+) TRANSPORT GROWTH DEFECT 1-like [Quercus lobata]
MTTPLTKRLDDTKVPLNKAIDAERKGDDAGALKHYKEALEQYSCCIEELKKKFQLYSERVKVIEKNPNLGSSKTDMVQAVFSLTDSSPESSHVVKLSDGNLNSLGGLEYCKQVLREAAIWPIEYRHFFTGNRKPWRAVLLFGPPGSGKTLLAETIAAEAKFNFFSISPSDIVCKWMGESEQHVKDLFQEAREKAPSIIFIDEIDSLCGPRGENNEHEPSRRIKSELLVQMQGVCNGAEHVLILAATNTPYDLDKAIRRRFDMRIYIPLPNDEARKHIFKVQIGETPNMIGEEELKFLANDTEGFSGSDISYYVKDALYQSIRPTLRADSFIKTGKEWVPCQDAGVRHKKSLQELKKDKQISEIQVPKIKLAHFKEVRERHKPTVNEADLELLVKFKEEFGVEDEEPSDAPRPAKGKMKTVSK